MIMCYAGHETHATVALDLKVRGRSIVSEWPSIPDRLGYSMRLDVYDAPKYLGFRGYCVGQDETSLGLLKNGRHEGFETLLMLDILARGRDGCVVDLGCHVGWFTVLAALTGRNVIAVDGETESVALTRGNLGRNGRTAAVSHAWIADEWKPNIHDRIAFLKADIEGSEQSVERAFRNAFTERRIDFAMLEISPCFNDTYPALVERIASYGYLVCDIPSKVCDWKAEFEADPLGSVVRRALPPDGLASYVAGLTQSNFLFALPQAVR